MLLVFLALAEGLVLGLARVPQEEGNAEGGEGHNGKCEPVQLKDKKVQSLITVGI